MSLVKAIFRGVDKDGNEFVLNHILFDSDLEWVTKQFAEVNKAEVSCFVDDKKIFVFDFRKVDLMG